MKHVAFHSNQLGIRGTEVALYDYAHYNETILGNKSYIISDATKDLTTLKKFQTRFEVFLYNKFEECHQFVNDKNVSHAYFIKGGDNDGKLIPGLHNSIHGVFQNKITHGNSHAYVSEWLANRVNDPGLFVPHIVSLPNPTDSYRKILNIPDEHIVIGRYGGYYDFDLPFVFTSIYEVLQARTDITFLLMNTHQFGPVHPNIIFVEGTYNLQNKSNFINTCDYMIHARQHGESFGLAICEFLYHNKPVISWKSGLDQHHLSVLGDRGLWFYDHQSCFNLLNQLDKPNTSNTFYKSLVNSFVPEKVMELFDKHFLID